MRPIEQCYVHILNQSLGWFHALAKNFNEVNQLWPLVISGFIIQLSQLHERIHNNEVDQEESACGSTSEF